MSLSRAPSLLLNMQTLKVMSKRLLKMTRTYANPLGLGQACVAENLRSSRGFSTPSTPSKADTASDQLTSKAYFKSLAHFPPRKASGSFKAKDLEVHVSRTPKYKEFWQAKEPIVFGRQFTDHMLMIDWSLENGWSRPMIVPFGEFHIHPAAKVLNYGVSAFEGLKACRGDDGKLRLFRPWHHIYRLTMSSSRSCLPTFDEREYLDVLCELLRVDHNWVPSREDMGEGSFLYVRPSMIGMTGTLGVDPPRHACFYTILSPVQSYFVHGEMNAVSLLADPKYVRSTYGGAGDCKLSSNYGPAMRVQEETASHGYQAVLWLHGEDQKVAEAGMMNIFFYLVNDKGGEELVTPPLDGLILPGAVRRSVIELANGMKDKKFKVSERKITMKEVADAAEKGRLLECFGTGTATVSTPIAAIDWKGNCKIEIPTIDRTDALYAKFYKMITDIQYGRTKHDWGYIFK